MSPLASISPFGLRSAEWPVVVSSISIGPLAAPAERAVLLFCVLLAEAVGYASGYGQNVGVFSTLF